MPKNDKKCPNRLGQVGLFFSIMGFVSFCSLDQVGGEFIRYVTLLSVVGLLISLYGLRRRPRTYAAWGVTLGLFGTLYLPTVFLPVLSHVKCTQTQQCDEPGSGEAGAR